VESAMRGKDGLDSFPSVRDCFLAAFRFQPCPRTPRWEFGYWGGTLQRWYQEGLTGCEQEKHARLPWAGWVSGSGIAVSLGADPYREHDVNRYFNLDHGSVALDMAYTVYPFFDEVILEETPEYIIRRLNDGVISKVLKPEQGMPMWIDYPVHNRREWEQFKADRLQPDLSPRIPADWENLLQNYRKRDYPLCIGSGATGYFGTVRQFLGLEKTLTTFYDDPAWMHEMMDYLADFYVHLYDQALSQVKVDFAVHWEDMCYVGGPLISPRLFREFMLKPYQKLTALLRDHGVDIIFVDSDGDVHKLLDLFIEGGVTAMYPFEVQSHMDVAAIRQKYPRLGLQGGIDKKAVAAGKDAIDRELEARLPVILSNGYIPHIDHGIPPDVSWENFCYYRRKLDSMLDEYDQKREGSN
jgi:hypothetical protein